jgi:hypothetical protein
MGKCWPLQMPPTQKAVLISLADNANDQGECWPSIPTISQRTCFSERAVHGAIKWLEENGLVHADRANGRHTRYCITPDGYEPPQQLRPRSSCASEGDAVEPPQQVQKPPQEMQSPPQQLRSNRKEPSRTTKSNRQEATPDLSCWPAQPSPEVLRDWLALRHRKRADVSETVVKAMAKQLRNAIQRGWSVDECLSHAVLSNWQGFNADWLEHRQATSQRSAAPQDSAASLRPL